MITTFMIKLCLVSVVISEKWKHDTLRSSRLSILTNHKIPALRMYFERLLLTNRPPPMSPPMSHTFKVIWSVSSFVPLGKKSSRLAMMLMKAVGNRMRPVRRAHFPVQHISSFFILLSVFASFSFLSPPQQPVRYDSQPGIFPVNRRDEVMVRTRGGGGTLAWPNPTQQIQPEEIQTRKEQGPTVSLCSRLPFRGVLIDWKKGKCSSPWVWKLEQSENSISKPTNENRRGGGVVSVCSVGSRCRRDALWNLPAVISVHRVY